jgi:hypothetical protein
MREADARAHSVAIKPVDLLKTRATAEGLASAAEADLAAAGEAGSVADAAAAVAAAEVVAEAVADAAEVAGDDASWRFGSLVRIFRNRNVLRNSEPTETNDAQVQRFRYVVQTQLY